jgi:hypothetical protein
MLRRAACEAKQSQYPNWVLETMADWQLTVCRNITLTLEHSSRLKLGGGQAYTVKVIRLLL